MAAKVVLDEAFWSCWEQKRPIRLPGSATTLPELFGLDTVLRAFHRSCLPGCESLSAFKRGEPCVRENFVLAYLDDATLSLSDAERYFPPLLGLCQDLAADLGHVKARLVLEPGTLAPTGPPLLAEGDLLAVQLFGEQRFAVSKPLMQIPISAPRPVPFEAVIGPGDAVFIPQGLEFRASKSPGGPAPFALYLLLTIGGAEQSLESSLSDFLTDVLREKCFSDEADLFFRSAVTKQTPKGAELDPKLSRCAAELVAQLTAERLQQHFAERMAKLREEQTEEAAKVSSMGPLPPGLVFSQSLVRLTPGIRCRCTPGSSVAQFQRGPETLNLPISPSASELIAALSSGEPQPVSSLPCQNPLERIGVCQVLVFKCCLEVLEPRVPSGEQGLPSFTPPSRSRER